MANLTQLRMLENLDGFLLVDKPAGLPFATVIKTIKRKFNLVKVGHGGSLDAMASGLFVVLVGDANRLADRVMGADRDYSGTLEFGRTTNTGDAFGAPADYAGPGPQPHAAEAESALKEFRGDVFQCEPRFASVRKEGTGGYEVVETGEHSQFMAHVYRLAVAAIEGERVDFTLTATKGFLPRAMAIELGATLTALRRLKVGHFEVKDAIAFDRLLETEIQDFAALVKPLQGAFK